MQVAGIYLLISRRFILVLSLYLAIHFTVVIDLFCWLLVCSLFCFFINYLFLHQQTDLLETSLKSFRLYPIMFFLHSFIASKQNESAILICAALIPIKQHLYLQPYYINFLIKCLTGSRKYHLQYSDIVIFSLDDGIASHKHSILLVINTSYLLQEETNSNNGQGVYILKKVLLGRNGQI